MSERAGDVIAVFCLVGALASVVAAGALIIAAKRAWDRARWRK